MWKFLVHVVLYHWYALRLAPMILVNKIAQYTHRESRDRSGLIIYVLYIFIYDYIIFSIRRLTIYCHLSVLTIFRSENTSNLICWKFSMSNLCERTFHLMYPQLCTIDIRKELLPLWNWQGDTSSQQGQQLVAKFVALSISKSTYFSDWFWQNWNIRCPNYIQFYPHLICIHLLRRSFTY